MANNESSSESCRPNDTAETTGTAGAAEAWWDAPVRGRSVAAYQAGRLLNQLKWHLQLSLFFKSDFDAQMVIAILRRLELTSLEFSEETRNPIREAVQAVRNEWRLDHRSKQLSHPDEESLADVERNPEAFLQLPDQWKRFSANWVAAWVTPLTEKIRGAIRRHAGLKDRKWWAFELGDYLDRGIRRPDVHKFIYSPSATNRSELDGERFLAGEKDFEEKLRRLVNYCPVPGGLPPDESWLDKVSKLCEMVGISRTVTEKPLTSLGSADRAESLEDVRAAMEQADELIRAELAHDDHDIRNDGRSEGEPSPTLTRVDSSSITGSPNRQDAFDPADIRRLCKIKESIIRDANTKAKAKAKDDAKAKDKDETKSKDKDKDHNIDYIGQSIPILRVFERIDIYNWEPNNYPVFILGPRGAGKTQISELIHIHSGRTGKYARKSARAYNAADPSLPLSEWAGIEKDSGIANAPEEGKAGLLEECEGGTIFLDDLQNASNEFQDLLLDVAEKKKVSRVGVNGRTYRPDVRLILATNMDPVELVKSGRLKADLLDRINTYELRIPPLKERREDIFHFLKKFCAGYRPTNRFRLALLRYDWPGNIRELRGILEKACRFAQYTHTCGRRREAEVIESESEGNERRSNAGVLDVDLIDGEAIRSIVDTVKNMSDDDAEREVYQYLAGMLIRQGYGKGVKGMALFTAMAELLDVSNATITAKANDYLPDLA